MGRIHSISKVLVIRTISLSVSARTCPTWLSRTRNKRGMEPNNMQGHAWHRSRIVITYIYIEKLHVDKESGTVDSLACIMTFLMHYEKVYCSGGSGPR